MKPKSRILTSFIVCALMPLAHAQTNGTWTLNNNGTWSTSGNWSGGNIASGATATANFSTLNITANRTVTIDSPFTIGTLTAQDLTTASHDWIFDGTGPLTLDNGVDQPLITVSNRTATISAPLAGTNGIRKNGAGLLVLSGNNPALSGTLLLDDVTGTNNAGVAIDGNNAVGGLTQITINGGAGSGSYLELRNGATLPNTTSITLNSQGGNSAPAGAIRTAGADAVTINSPISVTFNQARISNTGATRLVINGAISGGTNAIMFRQANNEGIHLTNTGNSWSGTTIHSGGTLTFEPGALPASNITLAASDPGTIQTRGSFTRALGTGTNQIVFAESAGRAQGFGARGGDLTVNLGGAGAEVLFDTLVGAPASRIRTNTLVLNGGNADSKITLVNPLNLNGGARTIQVSANVAELTGGINGGAFDLTKTGAGTLNINAPVTHSGNIVVNGGSLHLAGSVTSANNLAVNSGTLRVSGLSSHVGSTTLAAGTTLELANADNRLPTTGTLAFAGSSTFDLTTTNQTLSTFTTPDLLNVALAVKGSGTFTVNGASNLQIGPGGAVTTAHAVSLDMSLLDEFIYSNAAGVFRVGLKASSGNTGNLGQVATANLAATNSITAATLAIGDVAANNHGGTSTLNLGQANLINADTLNIGTSGRSNSNLIFNPSVSNPTATFRGTDGTSPVNSWRVGQTVTFNGTTWTDVVNLSAGTIDASVNSLVIGTADIPGSQTGRGGVENASFTMGNGTLQTSTMLLGRISSNAASTITSTMAGNGTFTLDHASGLLKATTITLAENTVLATGTGLRSVSGTLNLTNGTIEATTIQRGAQTGNATATTAFNWTNGTLRNTSGADLLIDTLPVTLASGTHTFEATGANSITLNATSPLGGTGGFVKTGTGTLVLNAPSTYSGTADVQQGTLAINNTLPPAADFVVNASATLSLANLTLNYNTNTGRALDIDGNLVIAGPVKVAFPGNPQGTTAVLDHGSITGTGNLTSDYRNASFNSTATTTSMTVNPGLALTWTGTNGDAWDLKSTINWKDGGNNPETFFWWDAVSFDESGALTQPSVNLIGDLRPASVSVNSTTDYTFGGTGSLTGTFTLTKNGASTLNLGGSHSFDGGISIQGGTLKPVGNQSLGANGQVITVASGATLDANGAMNADRDYEAVISGTGVGGLGAIVNTGADLTNGFGSLTLAADATIGGPGRWEVRPITPGTAVVDLGGHTLTKTGSNFIAFTDGSMTSAGTLNINGGSITMARMDVSGSGNINVNAGAALRFNNQSSGLVSKPINLADGALELTGNNNFTLDSAVSVTGTGTINVSSGRILSLSSAVSGSGDLTKADAGHAILLADNTYAGITTVSAGTLQFGNLGTTGAPGAADIVNNATLRFARIGNTTVANNISGTGSLILGVAGLQTATEWDSITTLTGNNTFAGDITVNSGGLRILNASALGTGPKTINANNGSNGRSQIYLDGTGGNITVPANIVFRTSNNDANRPALGSLGGNNVIEGTITLTSGGSDTVVKVDSGSLTLNGQITTSAPSVRLLRLSGTSGANGTVNGKLTNGNTPLGVLMQGANTWTLTNNDSDYTGTTTVNSGTLLINGNQTAANGAVTVNTGGTLGGTGTVGGSTTANVGGTIAPGTSIGTLSTTAPVNIAGTLAIEVNASTSDRLTVGGALDLDETTSVLAITELAAPSQPVYIIASYSGLNGTFDTITGMPSGYSIDYNYNNLNQIALVSGASSPFSTWINSFTSLTDPNDKLPGADPDDDGANNLMEFALNGDPTDGGNNGLSASLVQDATAPAGNELTLIIAARRGATFGAGPNGTRTATKDGVKYTIEGSPDLNFPGGAVSHAGASDTAPVAAGLPSLVGEDWEYHTFSLDSSENLPNKGFLRAVVE